MKFTVLLCLRAVVLTSCGYCTDEYNSTEPEIITSNAPSLTLDVAAILIDSEQVTTNAR